MNKTAADLAVHDMDICIGQVGDLLTLLMDVAGGEVSREAADRVIAIGLATIALLGKTGEAVDTLHRHFNPTYNSGAGATQ